MSSLLARRGYSIAMLLLLTAAAGVIFALIGSATRNPKYVSGALALTNGLLTFAGGVVVGGILGLGYRNPASGFFIGSAMGGLSGAAAGALSASQFSIPLAGAGAAAIVLLGAVVRYGSSPGKGRH